MADKKFGSGLTSKVATYKAPRVASGVMGVAGTAARVATTGAAARSGGGATSGGGGGVYVPPVNTGGVTGSIDPVSEPNPGRGGVAGGETTGSTTLEDLTEEQISAAMAAIEAQYGMTREQLLSDRSMAGLAYQRLTAELTRAREVAQQGVEQDALRRGLFDSGISARQQGTLAQQFAEQRAVAAQERQARIDAINASLAQLTAQQEAEKAAEEARIRREALERQQTTTEVV